MSEDYHNPRFLERVTKWGGTQSVDKVAVVFENYGQTVALPMSAWNGKGFLPTGYGVRLTLPMHGDWRCEDVEVYANLGELRIWREFGDPLCGDTSQLPERLTLAEVVARGLEIKRPLKGHFRFKERRRQGISKPVGDRRLGG